MSRDEPDLFAAGPGPPPPAVWETLSAPPASAPERFRLVRGGAVLLEADGFRIIEPRGFRRSVQQPYDAITHLAATDRALLVGTTNGLSIVRASDFPEAVPGPDAAGGSDPAAGPEPGVRSGPEAVRQALLDRLQTRVEGPEIRRRIERLEGFARSAPRPYATWGVALACVLFGIAQLKDPMLEAFGAFVPDLFRLGEHWRAITGQLLHGMPRFPVHLAMNMAGLLLIGGLTERPLGALRTVLVLAAAALGTVVGSIYAGYEHVVGASGIVFGLAGALLALELHYPEALPSYWRMPRRLFIGALILQFGVIDQLVPVFAGEAHLGGFIAGYVAAWLLGAPRLDGAPPGPVARAAALLALGVFVAALLTAAPLFRHEGAALERHALRLLNSPTVRNVAAVEHDNAVAWFLVTEVEPTSVGANLAVALAGRAVDATARLNPNILDTLAEAHFQSGDRLAALLTIDEAIGLAPGISYFVEQRKRFSGERDPDDRPPPPGAEDAAPDPAREDGPPGLDDLLDGEEGDGVVL